MVRLIERPLSLDGLSQRTSNLRDLVPLSVSDPLIDEPLPHIDPKFS